MISKGARFVQSPNRSSREGEQVTCVVIHHISLPPGEFGGDNVEAFFCNRLETSAHPFYEEIKDARVSAHYFIDREGVLTQFVDTIDAAWHAGQSEWRGRDRVNRFSIGIELEGDEVTPYTDEQYQALGVLLKALKLAHPAIAPDSLVGHDEIAPGRKRDPGQHFDWERVRTNFAKYD
jgi:AmpD protein